MQKVGMKTMIRHDLGWSVVQFGNIAVVKRVWGLAICHMLLDIIPSTLW